MFFRKRNQYHLPLGILLGASVGIAGATALIVGNSEIRKAVGKEIKKCFRTGRAVMNRNLFAVK